MVRVVSLIRSKEQTLLVDLVIPALNEEQNIPALLAAVPRDDLRYVVVADNGSTDRTAELARAGGAVVVREAQRGYGAACLAALAWIGEQDQPPDAVAFIDADLADDPALLPQLWEPIARGEADLVLAARHRLAERGALGAHQRFGNWLTCRLIAAMTGRRYRDLGPMRVIRWSSLQQLGMTDRTWGWTVQMQFQAARLKLRTLETDTPYRRRHAGVSKISGSIVGSVRAGAKILGTLGRLWWQG